jgi:hypothetical protein
MSIDYGTWQQKERTCNVKTNKKKYMSDKSFADLKEALKDALAFKRGERRGLTVTRIKVTHYKGRTWSVVARVSHSA